MLLPGRIVHAHFRRAVVAGPDVIPLLDVVAVLVGCQFRIKLASGLVSFYVVAAIFGFIYAGVMPLYAVLARENFPQRMMGTVIGATSMAGGLGMALGPVAGGLIYDTFATYTWLYVGACGMGIGAFLVAMLFRPFPKSAVQTATA